MSEAKVLVNQVLVLLKLKAMLIRLWRNPCMYVVKCFEAAGLNTLKWTLAMNLVIQLNISNFLMILSIGEAESFLLVIRWNSKRLRLLAWFISRSGLLLNKSNIRVSCPKHWTLEVRHKRPILNTIESCGCHAHTKCGWGAVFTANVN